MQSCRPLQQMGALLWAIGAYAILGLRAVLKRRADLVAMHSPPVVLYDDVCVMCNGFVDLVLRFHATALVAPLTSPAGKRLMAEHGVPLPASSFVLVEQGGAYLKSDAALRCLSSLSPAGLWLWWMLFEPLPTCVRDPVYDLGWRWRRTLFGTCARHRRHRIYS